jgi:phosphatidylinositol alpha-1,6-mannosyltransferase
MVGHRRPSHCAKSGSSSSGPSDDVLLVGQEAAERPLKPTAVVTDAERDAALDRAHVFAMPSRLPPGGVGGEGFGIVYLEAGAHRLPVVAGAVGGALDAVVHEKTGLLVDPEDVGAVAQAVGDLLLDPQRAGELGDAGREHAQGFAWPPAESIARRDARLADFRARLA